MVCVGVGTGCVCGTWEVTIDTHPPAIGHLLKLPKTFLFQDFNDGIGDGACGHYITSYTVLGTARHCHKPTY